MLLHYESSEFAIEKTVELFSMYNNEGCDGEFEFDDSDDEIDPSDLLELRGAKIKKFECMFAIFL